MVGKIKRVGRKDGNPTGTPVVAGCGDQAANNLGAGVVERGTALM